MHRHRSFILAEQFPGFQTRAHFSRNGLDLAPGRADDERGLAGLHLGDVIRRQELIALVFPHFVNGAELFQPC